MVCLYLGNVSKITFLSRINTDTSSNSFEKELSEVSRLVLLHKWTTLGRDVAASVEAKVSDATGWK